MRRFADPSFQARMARLPLLRRIVRQEGETMFDLVAGFCHSQVLQALVRLEIMDSLLDGPQKADALARRSGVPLDRMLILLKAACALGLLKERRGLFRLTIRGAALAGVPGLKGMIDHHDVLYRDLANPVAFFRGEVETELAQFWPYVFGAGAAEDPERARRYSKLMADSQALVAEETLATVSFAGATSVMDVGGGSGTFLAVLGEKYPTLERVLFDLPAVVETATDAGLRKVGGSFRDDALPLGSDVITLNRVLYDHAAETVRSLLGRVFEALPPGGRIVVSEPMTGGRAPNRPGDAYFAIYCLAMQTGQARSSEEISALLTEAGFERVKAHQSSRPFVTSVVEAVRPK